MWRGGKAGTENQSPVSHSLTKVRALPLISQEGKLSPQSKESWLGSLRNTFQQKGIGGLRVASRVGTGVEQGGSRITSWDRSWAGLVPLDTQEQRGWSKRGARLTCGYPSPSVT